MSYLFRVQGIVIKTMKKLNSPWSVILTIHPTKLLGDDDPYALYKPTQKKTIQLTQRADELLSQVGFPCSVHEMLITRVDVTANLGFPDQCYVDAYLRILRKSYILPYHHTEHYKPGQSMVKDYKQANACFMKQSCKTASFFAYDKDKQLKLAKGYWNAKRKRRTLRLECQLHRRALKKYISHNQDDLIGTTLRELYQCRKDILNHYLERIQLRFPDYVRYQDAVNLIQEYIKCKKTKERLLYLIRKASDSINLNHAIHKTVQKFELTDAQLRKLLEKLRELGISPVTLESRSKFTVLPALKL